MTMLSPAATFHAELREQLGQVGRALSIQRALIWLARGLAGGTLVVLGVVLWAWARDAVAGLPLVLLAAEPLLLGLLVAVITLFIRHDTRELARRVDRAAGLQERSTTALELGARGDEFPLALAQMRDAVEHLQRVDLLEAFPLRLPKNELLVAAGVLIVAVIVGVSPNPWLLQARAANPAITVAREQAQRVQRVADNLPQDQSQELEQLRQLLNKGARTIDARSNEPDAALNALGDLEDQVRQMSAGDDQLAAALSAIASALAADQSTQQLASAINTGDLRQIAQATRELAQAAQQMSNQQRLQLAQTLRAASLAAARSSQSIASDLSDAANGLQASAGSDASSANGTPGQDGADQQGGQSASAQSAADALNNLSHQAAAAAARQTAANQLQSSRNALERALGRTQSRSGSTGRSSSSSSSGQRSQASSGQNGDQAQAGSGQGQGQGGEQGDSGDPGQNGGAGSSDQNGSNGDTGNGSGYSTGGQSQDHNGGDQSGLAAIVSPQQVPTSADAAPDQSSINPYLGDAGQNSANTSPENVSPAYSNKPTQGNDSGTIPLGLRDLVKDYFSSLDQKDGK